MPVKWKGAQQPFIGFELSTNRLRVRHISLAVC